jgi:hypothetical protein
MGGSSDSPIDQLEDQLEGAERTLAGIGGLNSQQAKRVAQRMDRLASQLLEMSEPAPIDAVHERLGTEPAGAEAIEDLASQMDSADGGEVTEDARERRLAVRFDEAV